MHALVVDLDNIYICTLLPKLINNMWSQFLTKKRRAILIWRGVLKSKVNLVAEKFHVSHHFSDYQKDMYQLGIMIDRIRLAD